MVAVAMRNGAQSEAGCGLMVQRIVVAATTANPDSGCTENSDTAAGTGIVVVLVVVLVVADADAVADVG